MTRKQRRNVWDKFVKTLERDVTGTQRDITGTQRDITGTQRDITGTQRDITGTQRDIKGTQRDITGTQRDITGTQRDITGKQRRGFKIRVFKQLKLQERDKLKIDPITKTEWKNTMENSGMSKAARGKKEQKRRGEVK